MLDESAVTVEDPSVKAGAAGVVAAAPVATLAAGEALPEPEPGPEPDPEPDPEPAFAELLAAAAAELDFSALMMAEMMADGKPPPPLVVSSPPSPEVCARGVVFSGTVLSVCAKGTVVGAVDSVCAVAVVCCDESFEVVVGSELS